MRYWYLLLVWVWLVPPARPSEVKSMTFETIDGLWQGFDPAVEPLAPEVLREWEQDGVRHKEFYFTGEVWQSEPVRVYTLFAAPASAAPRSLPGLVHLHGGGQTASPEWVEFWAKQGYAALSINWGGQWPGRDKVTRYPAALKQANHRTFAMFDMTHPNQHANAWYHWALLGRRALTALAAEPETDPERLGLFGTSMGGTLTWMVAGIDARIKAACAIYGAGWESHPPVPGTPDLQAQDPNLQLWRTTMAPEAYAPRIRCPILFLSASNDFHGRLDQAWDTLARLNPQTPFTAAITPNYSHHVEWDEGVALPAWMDLHLRRHGAPWPSMPRTAWRLDDAGRLTFVVQPVGTEQPVRVRVCFAREERNPMQRFWHDLELPALAGEQAVPIAWHAAGAPLYAFANLYYSGGRVLTSRLAIFIPATTGTLLNKPLDSNPPPGLGSVWYQVGAFTDPNLPERSLQPTVAQDGRMAVTPNPRVSGPGFHVATLALNDPQWRLRPGMELGVELQTAWANSLEVRLTRPAPDGADQIFSAQYQLNSAPTWQTLWLRGTDFRDSQTSAPLPSMDGVRRLELKATAWQGPPPLLGRLRPRVPG